MGLFKEDKTLLRIAGALERLVELYEIDLSSKGLTLHTLEGEGAIYETDEETLLEQERLENVRNQLGLPREFPVGSALPIPGAHRDLPKPSEEEERIREISEASPFNPFSGSSWGVGPEGKEDPFEGTNE